MTRQAITIKYHGPTNTRGSRCIASCEAGKVTVPVDNRYNSETNAAYAVLSLLKKLDWKGNWTLGGLPSGYVAVDHSGNWGEFETTVDVGTTCYTFRDLAIANNH